MLALEDLQADAGALRLRGTGTLELVTAADVLASPLALDCSLSVASAAGAAALLPQARALLAPLGDALRLDIGVKGSPAAPEPRLELACAALDLGGHVINDLSLLAGGAVQAYALSAETVEPVSAVAEENCISSSWKRASDPALTEKVRKVFDKAFDGLEGVSYTPVALLASRTTGSGIQYRILCKATVVVPGAQEEYVVVTLQRGWLGKAEILDIGDPLCLTNLDYEEGAVGT